jgi:hypothetical protein
MVVLMAGLMTTFVAARRRLVGRGSACIIGVALLTGCGSDTVPPGASAKLPAIRFLPVNMTVKQRTTTAVPGSDESLKITVDDITAGQVMVSLAGAEGQGVLASTSINEGEAVEFKFQEQQYLLTLSDLNNELIGDDFATFVISSGATPSPALPAMGRESEDVKEAFPARGRESEEMKESVTARGKETEEITEALPARTSGGSVDPGSESEDVTEREKDEVTERGRGVVTEREKIERLLAAIESAEGDVFIRNGVEHAAEDAAEHLRSKWQAAGEQIKTAEEFIDKIATKSSLSGEAYRVRRADGTEVLASDYLREKLSGIEHRQPAVE